MKLALFDEVRGDDEMLCNAALTRAGDALDSPPSVWCCCCRGFEKRTFESACECVMMPPPAAVPTEGTAATCVEVDAEELEDAAIEVGEVVPEVVAVPELLHIGCIARGDGCGDSAGVQSSDMDTA